MHAYNALLWVKHHEMLSATERNLIGRRTESDRTADANGGTLRGCTFLRSALPLARARSAPTKQY